MDAAFNQIRQFGSGSVAVSLRLLEVMAQIGPHLRSDEQRNILAHHVAMIYQQSLAKVEEPSDKSELKGRYDMACKALDRDLRHGT